MPARQYNTAKHITWQIKQYNTNYSMSEMSCKKSTITADLLHAVLLLKGWDASTNDRVEFR